MNDYENEELMALAAELPKEIQPDRDLLPEISARSWRQQELRIEPAGRGSLVHALYPYRTQLAAAVVVLVALTAALTSLLVRSPATSETEVGSPVAVQVAEDASAADEASALAGEAPTSASLARYEAVEASYAAVIEQLMFALEAHRAELAPEIVELIETNLAIIDHALAESLAALEGSPADPALRRAVAAAYEQKVGLLRQASTLTTGL